MAQTTMLLVPSLPSHPLLLPEPAAGASTEAMYVAGGGVLELFQNHFRILAGLLTKRSGGPSPEAWAGSLVNRHRPVAISC